MGAVMQTDKAPSTKSNPLVNMLAPKPPVVMPSAHAPAAPRPNPRPQAAPKPTSKPASRPSSGITLDNLLYPAGTPQNNALGPHRLPNGMQDAGRQFSLPKGYDPKVAAFQKAHGGLTVDGLLGPKTIAAGYGRPVGSSTPTGHPAAPHATAAHPAVNAGGGGSSGGASGGSVSGGGGPSLPSSGGAGAGVSDTDYLTKATNSVNAELNPQLAELQRQIDALTNQYNRNSTDVTSRGARQQTDLQALYDRLGNFTQGVQGVQDKNYASTHDADAARYAALQQQLQGTFQGQQSSTQAELQRLGIGNVSPDATAALTRDAGYLKGLTGVDAANAATNLDSSRNAFDALMTTARGNAATEGTVQRGQAQRDTAKQLADLLAAFNGNRTELAGKKGDIAGTRGQKIQELMDALKKQDQAAAAAAQQQDFENQLARDKFNLSYDDSQFTHGLDTQKLSLDKQRLAQDAASKAAAKAAKVPPLDRALGSLTGPHAAALAQEFKFLLTGNATERDPLTKVVTHNKPTVNDPITNLHLAGWLQRNAANGMTQADVDALIRALAIYNGKA